MKASVGVTISSIVALIGSGLTLLLAFGMAASFWLAPAPEAPVAFVKVIMIGMAVLTVACAGWGIASGIGLLLLREWARISTIVFAVLLILFCLPGGALFAFMPLPNPPNTPPHFLLFLRIGMAGFYLLLAAIGIWWVYFLNRKKVKEQFRPELAQAPRPVQPGRPISISIIGCFLLVCGCLTPFCLLLRVPLLFFGFLFTGWVATAIFMAFGIISIVMGVGLLMLKPWARVLTICYFIFGGLNSLSVVVIPGATARFQTEIVAMQARMNLPQAPQPVLMPMWFMAAAGLPVLFVVLWFVVTRKDAFAPSRPELCAPQS